MSTIYIINDTKAELTTDHSASSYRMPVLIVEGKAYGPADDIKHTSLAKNDPFNINHTQTYTASDAVFLAESYLLRKKGDRGRKHAKSEFSELAQKFLGNCEHTTHAGAKYGK